MRALAYLEWRFMLHQIAAIGRSPLRLAIWIPYAISLGYLAIARTFGDHHTMFGTIQLDAERLTGIGGLYLGTLGITIAMSANGRVSAFRSAAEAILFSNAGLRPLEMAIWLQVRKLAASSMRWTGALFYYFLIFFPRHASFGTALTAFIDALLAVTLLMSVELPMFLLSRGSFNAGLRAFGYVLAFCGFAYASIGFAGERVWRAALAIVHVDPGAAVRSIQNGSPNALAVILAILVVMLVAIGTLAHDSLPELYAVSRRSLAETRRRQSAVRRTRYGNVVSTKASHIPLGALALAWKDWVGFRRGRGSFYLWLGGCAFWSACGAAAAYASVVFEDAAPLFALFSASGLLLLFFAPTGASAGLAGDVGKPIFWLGEDKLRTRLAAWTLGRALRGGIALGLAPACAGGVLGRPLLIVVALPLSLCAYWSLQALGIGLYALFPNPMDARGPMALVRTVVTIVYVLPPVVLGFAAGTLGDSAVLAVVTTCLGFVAEGLLSIELAAYRFRETGAAMALVSTTS